MTALSHAPGSGASRPWAVKRPRVAAHWTQGIAVGLLLHLAVLGALVSVASDAPVLPPPSPPVTLLTLAPPERSPPVKTPPAPRPASAPKPAPPSPRPKAHKPAKPSPARHAAPTPAPPPAPAATEPAATEAPAQPLAPSPARADARPVQPTSSAATPDWRAQLLGHLNAFKHYPPRARAAGQQGTVVVEVTLARNGEVLACQIRTPSGAAPLDREAVATVERASPLPPPPPEIAGDPLRLVLPIRFSLE